jgi:hypothetical protein
MAIMVLEVALTKTLARVLLKVEFPLSGQLQQITGDETL